MKLILEIRNQGGLNKDFRSPISGEMKQFL